MDNDILKFLIKIYICLYVGLTKCDINQFGVREEKKLVIDDEKKKNEREWLKMARNDLTDKKWILKKAFAKNSSLTDTLFDTNIIFLKRWAILPYNQYYGKNYKNFLYSNLA